MLSVFVIIFAIFCILLFDLIKFLYFQKNPDKIIQVKKRLRFNIITIICLLLEIKLGLYSFLTWIGLILASLVVIIDMLVLIANKEKPSNDYKESHPMRFKFHLVVINIAVMIIKIVDVKKKDSDNQLIEQKEKDEND